MATIGIELLPTQRAGQAGGVWSCDLGRRRHGKKGPCLNSSGVPEGGADKEGVGRGRRRKGNNGLKGTGCTVFDCDIFNYMVTVRNRSIRVENVSDGPCPPTL